MTLDGKDRSPYRYFGRSTWEPNPGDRDILPKPDIVRPSFERTPFGGRERGGAYGGVLNPAGLGPFPEGFLDSADLGQLPWTRPRGDEWTTPEFRALVLAWLRTFFRAHPAAQLIGWDITERATPSWGGSKRLPPRLQYLLVGVTQRVGCDGDQSRRIECSQTFPPDMREGGGLTMQLEGLGQALHVQLAIV